MSEVRLNIIDCEGAVHGTVHGSVSDAVVASLSAEPQTVMEVEAAMARFIRPTDQRPFGSFKAGVNDEPWDAGVVLVDLAARVVASESLYSQPGKEGEVAYHDGTKATDVAILYRLPDDWVFLYSLAEYEGVRARAAELNLPQIRRLMRGRCFMGILCSSSSWLSAFMRNRELHANRNSPTMRSRASFPIFMPNG